MKHSTTLVMLIAALFLGGCLTTFYHPRYPVLDRPNRPTLTNVSASEMGKMSEDARKTVTGNFDLLISYCRKLEEAIDSYNKYAARENATLKTGETK